MPDIKNFFVKTYIPMLLILLLCLTLLANQPKYGDELPHGEQIVRFINGDYTIVYYLTTIPGYEFVVATISRMLFIDKMPGIRLVSMLLSFSLLIPFFYLLSNKSNNETWQFFLLPVPFAFYCLLYTDLMSMGVVLAAFYYLRKGFYEISGLLCIISIFFRQNNVIWLAFMISYVIALDFRFNNQGIHFNLNPKSILKKIHVYIIGIVGFIIFVIINGGVVIGDRTSHPVSMHMTNIWVFLFMYFFIFLPSNIYNFKKILKKFLANKILLTIFSYVIFGFFIYTIKNDHPYNQYAVFIHNKVIMFATTNIYTTLIFFIPIIYSILILMNTKFKRWQEYLVYPFSFLILLTSWMVEFRYYFVIWAFIMLFRTDDDPDYIKYYTIAYYSFINIIMILGIACWKIFW